MGELARRLLQAWHAMARSKRKRKTNAPAGCELSTQAPTEQAHHDGGTNPFQMDPLSTLCAPLTVQMAVSRPLHSHRMLNTCIRAADPERAAVHEAAPASTQTHTSRRRRVVALAQTHTSRRAPGMRARAQRSTCM
jgi:hypothetical protein